MILLRMAGGMSGKVQLLDAISRYQMAQQKPHGTGVWGPQNITYDVSFALTTMKQVVLELCFHVVDTYMGTMLPLFQLVSEKLNRVRLEGAAY